MRRLWLTLRRRVFCDNCYEELGAGLTYWDSGVQVCWPCEDMCREAGKWPAPRGRFLLWLDHVIWELPMLGRRVFHLHEWVPDQVEYDGGTRWDDCYYCEKCDAWAPDNGRVPFPWNPWALVP